ncbi:hypothetical protein B0J12DRAFT_534707, partial [Macrophomina phaseolina]
ENGASGLVNSPDPVHGKIWNKPLGPELPLVAEAVRKVEGMAKDATVQGPEKVQIAEFVHRVTEQADVANFIAGLNGGLGTRVGPRGRLLS